MEPDVKRPARSDFRTICEVHRQLYVAVIMRKPTKEIVKLIEEAYGLGKKMDKKLREYKKDYDEGFWQKNQ